MTSARFPCRAAIALSAVAATIIIVAVITSAGSAKSSPRTLKLLASAQSDVGFRPDHPPQQGDRFGGGSKITGSDRGFNRTVCTVIGTNALCTIQLILSRGEISAQGLVPNKTRHSPIAITGGTGVYNGARGTAFATQINPTKTRFTIKLRP